MNNIQKTVFIVFLTLTVIGVNNARAEFELGIDLTSSRNIYERSVKTHSFAFVAFESYSMGLVYLYEMPHSYMKDEAIGFGISFGREWFLEIAGGSFRREYKRAIDNEILIGRGHAFIIMPGWKINDFFRLSLPVIMKRINSGDLAKRNILDVVPYIGLQVSI